MARKFSKPFYDSKQWKETREYILKRDNYLCVKCKRPAQEVHHIIHLNEKNINDVRITVNPKNLVSLCRDCHFAQHEEDKLRGTKKFNSKNKCDLREGYEFDENGMVVESSDTRPGVKR